MNWLLGWKYRRQIWLCGGLGDEPDKWDYGDELTVANDMLDKRFRKYERQI